MTMVIAFIGDSIKYGWPAAGFTETAYNNTDSGTTR